MLSSRNGHSARAARSGGGGTLAACTTAGKRSAFVWPLSASRLVFSNCCPSSSGAPTASAFPPHSAAASPGTAASQALAAGTAARALLPATYRKLAECAAAAAAAAVQCGDSISSCPPCSSQGAAPAAPRAASHRSQGAPASSSQAAAVSGRSSQPPPAAPGRRTLRAALPLSPRLARPSGAPRSSNHGRHGHPREFGRSLARPRCIGCAVVAGCRVSPPPRAHLTPRPACISPHLSCARRRPQDVSLPSPRSLDKARMFYGDDAVGGHDKEEENYR